MSSTRGGRRTPVTDDEIEVVRDAIDPDWAYVRARKISRHSDIQVDLGSTKIGEALSALEKRGVLELYRDTHTGKLYRVIDA